MTRRQLIRLGAGAVVVIGVGACRDGGTTVTPPSPSSTNKAPETTGASSTTTTDSSTSSPSPSRSSSALFGGRRLVVVQLNGGNDLLNTVPPRSGQYRDLRPTLAVPEADQVGLWGVDDAALHPSLAPLVPLWDAGQLAVLRGIGFENPNRSHFVSMDRWWHADDLGAPGWLGRVLDGLDAEPLPLMAATLGGRAPLLFGASAQPTVVNSPASFHFAGIRPEWLTAIGAGGGGGLVGAARHALTRAVHAVADFADLSAGPEADDDPAERERGANITAGLAVAARMLVGDVGSQLVVVSASGFDTHADQANRQAALLTDLAEGMVSFFDDIEKAGVADDVLVVTTSEFGRRAAENGSGGTDHGAGGLSFAAGRPVVGGMYGEVDLADLLDGDVRPSIDPRALYTACLDWLGADAERVLGRRYDEVSLLRR